MKRARRFLFAMAMLVSGFAIVHPEQAKATTMVATLCQVAINPCPGPNTLDSGFRSNLVGVLGANRFAVLPFSFSDKGGSVNGTVVVADFAAKYIYLVGFGAASSDAAGANIDIAISQDYLTTPGPWDFKGFNIGSCNAVATNAGDSVTSLPYVNGVPMGGAVTSLCSPFAQFFALPQQPVGLVTTLTAAAIFSFNGGKGQKIGLPWGDDFPFPGLDIGPDTTLQGFVNTLKSDGLEFATVPEPAGWTMLIIGFAVMGFMMRPARRAQRRAA
jgi:hypothetical protein